MQTNQLQKTLGLSAALSTVVGGVIGSGVFFKPQAIYTATGGAPGLAILSWIVAGLITIAAGLTVAELAAAIPKTGGMMIYIKEIYGEKIGFLAGWVQSVLFLPGIIAALAVIFADQFTLMSGMSFLKLPIALFVIVVLTYLNTLGTRSGGIIQNLSTICKVAVLVTLIVLGFLLGEGNNPILSPLVASDVNPVSAFGQVLLAIFFAFDGWINVTALAGEIKDPSKNLPKAIIGGLSIVAAIYLIINISYLWVVPASELASSVSPASTVAIKLLGPIGGKVIGVGIMISVFGACNAYVFAGSRVIFALSQTDHFPMGKWISKVNNNNTPRNALITISALSCIYALSGQFNFLTDLAIFSIWIFIVLCFFGVMKLRKEQPHIERQYKVPLYPFIPILAISSGVFVLVNQIITNTPLAAGSIAIMLIGLPIFNYMSKKTTQ